MKPLDPISQAFICSLEGFRALPYDDKDGKPIVLIGKEWRRPNGELCKRFPTIGYGQRIWGPKYYGPCTKEQAKAWFQKGLEATYLPAVDRTCGPNLTNHQRGAFASFCYNCGAGGLVKSGLPEAFVHGASLETLKKLWCEGYGRTSAGILDPGLVMRRAREWVFFNTPDVAVVPETGQPVDPSVVLASVWRTADEMVNELVIDLVKGDDP